MDYMSKYNYFEPPGNTQRRDIEFKESQIKYYNLQVELAEKQGRYAETIKWATITMAIAAIVSLFVSVANLIVTLNAVRR